jgi:hypothetical protein
MQVIVGFHGLEAIIHQVNVIFEKLCHEMPFSRILLLARTQEKLFLSKLKTYTP